MTEQEQFQNILGDFQAWLDEVQTELAKQDKRFQNGKPAHKESQKRTRILFRKFIKEIYPTYRDYSLGKEAEEE